jgi:hypothetical protein
LSLAQSTVSYFRAEWAGRFVDSCTVARKTGTTFDEGTGQTTDTMTTVYSGECLLRPAEASETDFGETRRQLVDYDLYLPFVAAELAPGDRVTVTSDLDPIIPVLTVLRGFSDSYKTRSHYELKVIS